MIILAADTSSSYCSAAIWREGRIISESCINNGLVHSEMLMPIIEQVMLNCSLEPFDVDIYACVTGPGSFTGVRIAVSTIKGLAHAHNKPCAAVNTLEAAARGVFSPGNIICSLLDARRGQVYAAAYMDDWALIPPCALPVGKLAGELNKLRMGRKIIFTGDGAGIHMPALKGEMENIQFAPQGVSYQRAALAAQLAFEAAGRGELLSCFELDTFYLRKPQAEREYESRNKL